jgi:hypothetical protein
MATIEDLLNCFCLFMGLAAVAFVSLMVIETLIKKLFPGTVPYFEKAKEKVSAAKSGGLPSLFFLPIVALGEPFHLFYRVLHYARDKRWKKREELSQNIPLLFSVPMLTLLFVAIVCVNILFYCFAERRAGRDLSPAQRAQKVYETALAKSVKVSNRLMKYNQDIQDQHNNDPKRKKFEVHPVWHMRNFPNADDDLVREAEENYGRVFEEEAWTMRGGMPDRLMWADQFRMRAKVIAAHRRDWSQELGRNYEGYEYRDHTTKTPSW